MKVWKWERKSTQNETHRSNTRPWSTLHWVWTTYSLQDFCQSTLFLGDFYVMRLTSPCLIENCFTGWQLLDGQTLQDWALKFLFYVNGTSYLWDLLELAKGTPGSYSTPGARGGSCFSKWTKRFFCHTPCSHRRRLPLCSAAWDREEQAWEEPVL